jgi:hypothetical protein
VLDFFVIFFLIDATFSTGSLEAAEAVARAAIAAIANPSVVAGASATAAVPSGIVELVLVLFAAPSADRLFTVNGRFSVEDGELACVARAGRLAPADPASIGRSNVRAATEGSEV